MSQKNSGWKGPQEVSNLLLKVGSDKGFVRSGVKPSKTDM